MGTHIKPPPPIITKDAYLCKYVKHLFLSDNAIRLFALSQHRTRSTRLLCFIYNENKSVLPIVYLKDKNIRHSVRQIFDNLSRHRHGTRKKSLKRNVPFLKTGIIP